jgi:hypothetical protein
MRLLLPADSQWTPRLPPHQALRSQTLLATFPRSIQPSVVRFLDALTEGVSRCAEYHACAKYALMHDGELAVCPGRDDYKYVYMAASTERGSAFPFQSIVKVDTCVPVSRGIITICTPEL